MTSLWGSLAPAQPRGLFGSDDDWLLTRAINGLGFGPMTQTTQAGRPNAWATASHSAPRPNDYMAPVSEAISPTMGAYGAGQMLAEGSRAVGQGDYLSGGAGLALGMAGLLPGPKKGIRAFHGSPHDFDRFDMSKIGTGEGAQAYGHGLYFAESEGVAKSYREKLGGVKWDFTPASTAEADAASEARRYLDSVGWDDSIGIKSALVQKDPELADAFDAMVRSGRATDTEAGRMYEVRINADPEDFLDWDKPLSQQSEKVRSAVDSLVRSSAADELRMWEAQRRTADRRMREMGFEPKQSPPLKSIDELVEKMTPDLFAKGNEAVLRDAGIPGIKYLDQGSRTAGDGSRNYVVFDDKLIDILRKYGLFGSLGMGGASGLFGTGEQSQ